MKKKLIKHWPPIISGGGASAAYKKTMLAKRVLTTLIIVPPLVAAVWFDEPLPWLTVFVAIYGSLAVMEFYRIVGAGKMRPLVPLGVLWTVLFIISPHFNIESSVTFLLASLVFVSLIGLLIRANKEDAFSSWAWTIGGVLYVGLLLSYFILLRDLDYGREWVLFALFVTFASDSAAYLVGSRWGKDPMAPEISPRKTWQGAIGGVLAAVAIGTALTWLFDLPISYAAAMLFALAVSVFGQTGDLVESLFKRNMHTKDSGNSIPGHGGFLDRMDSIAFAGIVTYYLVLWFV